MVWGSISAVPHSGRSAGDDRVLNPVYRRAQMLVNDGNTTEGRALIDSMVAGSGPRLERLRRSHLLACSSGSDGC